MVLTHAAALSEPFGIAQWSAWPLSVPLSRPYRSAKGTLPAIPLLHTQVRTTDGHVGNSLVYVPSISLLKSLFALVSSLCLDMDEARRAAFDHATLVRRRLGAWAHEGVGACAASALELALLDLISQRSGLGVAPLLGASAKPQAAYGGIGLGSPSDTLQEAERLLRRGHRALKLKLGHPTLDEDLASLTLVRHALGTDVKLMVDYNQSLSADEAIRRGQALEHLDLVWIEEPVAAADLDAHAAVAAALRVCLQSGENWWRVEQVRRAIDLRASDAVMLDPAKLGALAWLGAAQAVEAAGLSVSSHLSPHLCCQLLSSTNGSGWLEWTDWWDAFLGPIDVTDGTVQAVHAPAAWNNEALVRHRL